jgi:branched-chain amino acid transport system ATP-binding protein
MSGGEQQMVAIGRALMSSPVILMLDEPSLGLSPLLCTELFRTLKTVRDTGVGILLVEQNARQSLAIADRAYLLENGEIVGQGPAEQLARDPAVQAAYLGGAASHVPVVAKAPASAAPMSAAPAPEATVSADALVPTRIADLVRIAAQRQAQDLESQRSAPDLLDASMVAAAMAAVESAAARSIKGSPPPPPPAGLEVWHRPGLEIWRRQPDGSLKKED